MKIREKAILHAEVWNGRERYLNVYDGFITFPQILLIPNLTCSLRCKYCAAGNQYADRKVFDTQKTIDDFDKLMKNCATKQVNIQGGEVFLNPYLAEFFMLFSQMENIGNCGSIALFTNATVIPTDGQLQAYSKIDLPKKIMVSNYELPNVKLEKFVQKIKKFGLDFVVFPKDKWWFHPGTPQREIGYSDSELKEVINRCTKFCRAPKIIDGRFFVCGQNGYALYENLKDFVDVRGCDEADLKKLLFTHVFEKDCYDICKYCRGVFEGAENVRAAEQL